MPQSLQRLLFITNAIRSDDSNHGERFWRFTLFLGWQIWKRLVGLPLIVPVFNGLRFIVYPGCHVSSGFIYYKVPDYKEISFIRQHIDGGVLVDVGANVGSVTILLADKCVHSVLFEPNPLAAMRARENLTVNNLLFEVHELALSDTSGMVRLEDAGGTDGTNRLVVGFDTASPTRVVPRVSFDEFLQGRPIENVSIVKIDVEGHENSVLRGMRNFLREGRPRLVMFEYLQRTNLSETLRIFDEAAYTVFRLSQRGPCLLGPEVQPLQNLFACPREIEAEFSLTPTA